ncbi:PAS domain-containing protein [Paenibacillus albiflavus]|uniref:histidine kinase n=1 Tax=Paenibacillus albiflavus TaxID=2545760 RepID=A0A4R4ENN8_9BACL|nr:ATP-binding protein [Paenibacillus albiflavus]TCZ80151.1 PAS domain-containing protein [Paenibacillus albiflavus]
MVSQANKNRSIRTRYFRIIYILFAFVLLTGSLFYVYMQQKQNTLNMEREALANKTNKIVELSESLNDIFFRARGYYAFQNHTELELLNSALVRLDHSLTDFTSLALTTDEERAVKELREFFSNYKTNILPQAIKYVEAGDYAGLRNLSNGGTNKSVNEFLAYTSSFKMNSDHELDRMVVQSIQQADKFTVFAFIFSALILAIFALFIWRILRNLITPIVRLEQASNALAAGLEVELSVSKYNDELDRLSNAFMNMARSIQDKEEELTMQNEELQAQQEELNSQQTQLQQSLAEIESIMKALDQSAAVGILNRYGVFNYVNDRLCEYMQYKRSEIVGKLYTLFNSQEDVLIDQARIMSVIRNGGVWSDEIKCTRKDSSPIWLHLTIVPYLNEQGHIYQYILIANDISSVKNVQQQLVDSLNRTEATKKTLELYNQLNHEITYTLDKQEFTSKIVDYLNQLFSFDASLFMLVRDQIVSSKGLSSKTIARYTDQVDEELLYRLVTEKLYIVKREATPAELGITSGAVYAYDFYTAVMNANQELLAIFCSTRIGYPYDQEEIEEIQGLMNRVSLAVERLFMYEEIENARQLNQDIVNNVNEGIQFVYFDGSMRHYNHALSEILNCGEWQRGAIIQQEQWIEEFIADCKEAEMLRTFFLHALSENSTESSSIQYTIVHHDVKHIDVYATPVYRRNVRMGTLFVHRNITREFEIDQMKSELVSTVSHELRTPLASVLGFTELLMHKTLKPERQHKYLATIHKEAKRLTELINDFLDLQRMESGKQQYKMESIRLNHVVMQVIDQYKTTYANPILLIDDAVHSTVTGDHDKLVQVLTNLLSNAIKFSHAASEINISMHNEQQRVVVRISDQGIGIPQEQIASLFQKFRRVDNSEAKRIGGTGLGLAICKEILNSHEGEIGIESEEGIGTTVWFSLPLQLPNNEKDQSFVTIDSDNDDKPNVMIVEDDSSLALLLSEELKAKGYKVTHHYHPDKAYDAAFKTKFVCIVIDLILGEELNGWDLIRKLKSDIHTEAIPIIISSAIDQTDENENNNFIQKYLTKPYPPSKLSQTVEEIVQLKVPYGSILIPE